jgi:hypothetical protein
LISGTEKGGFQMVKVFKCPVFGCSLDLESILHSIHNHKVPAQKSLTLKKLSIKTCKKSIADVKYLFYIADFKSFLI